MHQVAVEPDPLRIGRWPDRDAVGRPDAGERVPAAQCRDPQVEQGRGADGGGDLAGVAGVDGAGRAAALVARPVPPATRHGCSFGRAGPEVNSGGSADRSVRRLPGDAVSQWLVVLLLVGGLDGRAAVRRAGNLRLGAGGIATGRRRVAGAQVAEPALEHHHDLDPVRVPALVLEELGDAVRVERADPVGQRVLGQVVVVRDRELIGHPPGVPHLCPSNHLAGGRVVRTGDGSTAATVGAARPAVRPPAHPPDARRDARTDDPGVRRRREN
ncbi:hypothetical protein Ae168Ps1_5969c [Pseudonocardia sp. Ae168_Ps1]|nr:hypothetical protein Ae168Ps1_5969c [Pseudonocardia sp. Ae168_Ps1]